MFASKVLAITKTCRQLLFIPLSRSRSPSPSPFPSLCLSLYVCLCLSLQLMANDRTYFLIHKTLLHAKYTFSRSNLFLTSQKENNTLWFVFTNIWHNLHYQKVSGLAESAICFASQWYSLKLRYVLKLKQYLFNYW